MSHAAAGSHFIHILSYLSSSQVLGPAAENELPLSDPAVSDVVRVRERGGGRGGGGGDEGGAVRI